MVAGEVLVSVLDADIRVDRVGGTTHTVGAGRKGTAQGRGSAGDHAEGTLPAAGEGRGGRDAPDEGDERREHDKLHHGGGAARRVRGQEVLLTR